MQINIFVYKPSSGTYGSRTGRRCTTRIILYLTFAVIEQTVVIIIIIQLFSCTYIPTRNVIVQWYLFLSGARASE